MAFWNNSANYKVVSSSLLNAGSSGDSWNRIAEEEEAVAQSSSELQSAGNVTIVKDILNQKIRIDAEYRKLSVHIAQKFVEQFIQFACQKDKLFKALFSRSYPTGSSFEGLRITDPNEYDIDLVFKVKSNQKFLTLSYFQEEPCYATCTLRDDLQLYPAIEETYNLIKRHLVETGTNQILPEKVLSWMQSVVDKIRHSAFPSVTCVRCISFSASGPAKTAIITTTFNTQISIDLVPVFEFRPPNYHGGMKLPSVARNLSIQNQFCLLVPKPYTFGDIEYYTARRLWRVHFPEYEYAIIHNRGCSKPVIKMLKLVRDQKRIHSLKSYFIKTIVMNELVEHPEKNWNEKYMDERFLEVLEKLVGCLMERKIGHVLFPNYNLLRIGEDTATNITHQLRRLYNLIKQNFSNIYTELNVY